MESVHAAHLAEGGPVKKVAVGLAVSLLALCLLIVVGHGSGTLKGQTSSQPATSAPVASSPAVLTPDTANTTYGNRPVGRWVTSNMVFLTTLINDTKSALAYLEGMNLAYAEIACPQLRCDIAVLQGRPTPRDALAGSRALASVPSGYRCPPIPDAQSAADLNAGMAQLESAIAHIINGENTFNGDFIQLGEAEMKAASATFDKVLDDLGKAAEQQVP